MLSQFRPSVRPSVCLSVTRVDQLIVTLDVSRTVSEILMHKSRRELTRETDPTVFYRLLSREPERISTQTLYRQKLESMPEICTTDSMCLSLLVFTQLFSEVSRGLSQPNRRENRI